MVSNKLLLLFIIKLLVPSSSVLVAKRTRLCDDCLTLALVFVSAGLSDSKNKTQTIIIVKLLAVRYRSKVSYCKALERTISTQDV